MFKLSIFLLHITICGFIQSSNNLYKRQYATSAVNPLHGSTRDEEPLVDARVNGSGRKVFSMRSRGERAGVNTVGTGLGNSQVGTVFIVS